MKYFYLIVFNILAVVVLWAFFFPKGGLLDNIEKMDKVAILEFDKAKSQMELEQMKANLYQLKNMQLDDPQYLAQQGRKLDNTVIFRINNKDSLHQINMQFHQQREFLRFRLYVMLAVVLVSLVIGNILLLVKRESRI